MSRIEGPITTVHDAYRVHRAAVRNVGKGRGYTHPLLDEALKVLEPFWAVHNSMYVTREIVEKYDREHAAA